MELGLQGVQGVREGYTQIVPFYYCLQLQFFRPSASTDLDKVDDGSRHDIRCMLLYYTYGVGFYVGKYYAIPCFFYDLTCSEICSF